MATTAQAHPTQRLTAVLTAIAALVLVLTASQMLIAALEAHRADLFLADWYDKSRIPSEKASQVALDAAYAADNWYPVNHGDHKERLGKVYEWRQHPLPFGAPEAEAERRRALEAYRQVAELRPTWPYGWTNIAHTKLQLLELDHEFMHAFTEASRTGPWNRETLKALAITGISAWPRLSADQRAPILETIAQAVSNDRRTAKELSDALANSGLLELVCFYSGAMQQNSNGICRS